MESGGKAFSGTGGGSRTEEKGLEVGGAGKREYLGFLASIVGTFGGISGVGRQSMERGERVERVGGKCESDSG